MKSPSFSLEKEKPVSSKRMRSSWFSLFPLLFQRFFVFCDEAEYIEPTTDGTEEEKNSNNFWISIDDLDYVIEISKDTTLLSVLAKLLSLLEN